MANDSPNPLDVGRLRLLREVALRGTIAGAARTLGLTASAVSQQLAVLERETGTVLLDRSPRGVELTGAGHLLVEHAGAVLELLARAQSDLDGLAGEIAGPVRVASVTSAAVTFVSVAAARLRTSSPGLELGVVAAEPARSMALLAAGDVDIAVVDEYDYVPLALPDYVRADQLVTEPLVVVTAPGLLEADASSLAELAGQHWIMPPDDAACGTAVRSACRAVGFEPKVRWESDDMLLLVRAVAAGHGIAVLPRLAVAEDAADVEVRTLRTPLLQRRISAVSRKSAAGRPVVQEVLRALHEVTRD